MFDRDQDVFVDLAFVQVHLRRKTVVGKAVHRLLELTEVDPVQELGTLQMSMDTEGAESGRWGEGTNLVGGQVYDDAMVEPLEALGVQFEVLEVLISVAVSVGQLGVD